MFNLTTPLHKRVYVSAFFFFPVRANFVKTIKINETLWMLEERREEEMFVLIDIRDKRKGRGGGIDFSYRLIFGRGLLVQSRSMRETGLSNRDEL